MPTMSHISTLCYCGKNHANDKLGWTVIRNTAFNGTGCVFKVYKREVPADKAHFADDLAPFTHTSESKARAAGQRGEFAYKREVV